MSTEDQVKQLEQRHAALDQLLDREITFLRMQEVTVQTTPWEKERHVLLTHVAIEIVLHLYADTLLDALRFRIYDLAEVRSVLQCRGGQSKQEVLR